MTAPIPKNKTPITVPAYALEEVYAMAMHDEMDRPTKNTQDRQRKEAALHICRSALDEAKYAAKREPVQ